MGKEVKDLYARRILQKYRFHPDGWSRRQDRVTQALNEHFEPFIGSKTGTLIKLGDGSTKAVQSIVDGDNLYPADAADSTSAERDVVGHVADCYTFVTDLGKSLTVTPETLIMLADGGAIEASQLVVGKEVATLAGDEIIVSRTAALAETVYSVFVNDRPMWYMAAGFWIWGRDWVDTDPAPPPDPLVITTSSPLTTGVLGRVFSQALAGTGGVGPYVWTLPEDPLPTGMTLSSGGALGGTPSVAGSYTVKIRLTDDRAAFVNKTFSLTINPALTITNASPLIGGADDEAYDVQLNALGGIPGYTFSLFSGSLPPGLSLSASGEIDGTATTQGIYTFTIRVTDGAAITFNKVFEITIAAALLITTSSPLADGNVGDVYPPTQLAATGGVSPYTWQITTSAFPPGIGISSGGLLTGTPTESDVYSFNVRVTDHASYTNDKVFGITIHNEPIITSTSPLAEGNQGTAYDFQMVGAGGTPAYTWSIVSGSLPTGLSMNSSGHITGTPSIVDNFSFTVRLTDANTFFVNKAFTLNITPLLEITSEDPADGLIDTFYSHTFTGTGGNDPYTWTIESGSIATGLSLSSGGVLSGTPTTYGNYTFVVRLTDFDGYYIEEEVPLTVFPTSPNITNGGTLDSENLGGSYSYQMTVSGGVAPYSWSVAGGELPSGLSMDTDGLITGTPNVPGTFNFALTVDDGFSQQDGADCSILINPDQLVITTGSPLPDATVAQFYSVQLFGTGGLGPYYWYLFGGNFPEGMTLNSDGQIYGYATNPGTTSFTVYLRDSLFTEVSMEFSLTTNDFD